MKTGWFVRSFLFVTSLLVGGLPASAQSRIVNIHAWIDGRSQLILQGATAQWQHFDWAAPGRLDCDTGSPQQATTIDGVEWWPVWPDVPTCENRGCGGCFSDVYAGIAPPLPSEEYLAQIGINDARGILMILELPTAANGYRTVILFDDYFGGAAWYDFELIVDECWAWSYCTSTANSSGLPARIGIQGGVSIGAARTALNVWNCPPNRPGIFFYGAEGANMPLANGRLCINPFAGTYRIGPAWTASAGNASLALDFASLPSNAAILPGTAWNFQYWFRDPAGGGTGSNLTDAVRARFCP